MAVPPVLVAAMALALAAPAGATVAAGVQKWRAGDWAAAVQEWAAPAARGDPDALFNMGQAYRLGRGVERNPETALDYYRRAAARGHVPATSSLGIALFQDGRRTEAVQHLREAADRGDGRAAHVLGIATFNGEGTPRNTVLGYAYMIRARQAGLPQADQQAARMATLMTADERARGEAAAAALAAGEPVPVDLLGRGAPRASPVVTAAANPSAAPAPVGATDRATGTAARPAQVETGSQLPPGERAGGWRVQLGAYASEQAARTAWAGLVAQSAQLLEGLTPDFSPRGGLVRLQVGPFDAREAARDLCARLSAGGRPCFVTGG